MKKTTAAAKPKSTWPIRTSSPTQVKASRAASLASSGFCGSESRASSALSRSSPGRSRSSCGLGSDGSDGSVPNQLVTSSAASGFTPAFLPCGLPAGTLRGLAFLALLLPPGRPFGGARKAACPLNARSSARAAARRISGRAGSVCSARASWSRNSPRNRGRGQRHGPRPASYVCKRENEPKT